MKKFEHKNKDEKRRILLSKNNVKTDLSKDNLNTYMSSDAEPRTGAGVLVKVQNVNKRIVAVVLAVAMVLSLLAIGATVFTTKAAGNTFVELNGRTDSAPVTLTNTYEPGTYYFTYTPENRTYSYNLDKTLIPGDTLALNPQTKEITYTHSPAQEGTAVSSFADVEEDPNNENVYTITVKNNQTISPGTTYYFEANDKFYMFSFEGNDELGYVPGDAGDNNVLTREDSNPIQNDRVVIEYNTETNTAQFSDSYKLRRKTVYSQTNTLSNNEVYVISITGNDDVERLLQYTNAANANKLSNSFGGSSTAYTVFPVSGVTDFQEINFVPNNSNGTEMAISESSITGINSAFDDLKLSEFLAQTPSNPNHTSNDLPYYFLYGVSTQGNQSSYVSSKAFANTYNNGNPTYPIYLNNLVGQTSQSGNYYDDNFGAVWAYDSGFLFNYNDTRGYVQREGWPFSADHTYKGRSNLNKYLVLDSNNRFIVGSSTNANDFSINIYQRQDVYEKTIITNTTNPITTEEKTITTVPMQPSTVSYDGEDGSSTVTRGGLVMDKTVTPDNDNDDLFHVTLDAHAEGSLLEIPPTDIELVLDTSRQMSKVLYTRYYENLDTFQYSDFVQEELSNLTNDNLFDESGYNDDDIITAFADILSGVVLTRNHTYNKYIEDPFAPGTYVYLNQYYDGEWNGFLDYSNYYTYSFTSSNGITYTTDPIEKRYTVLTILSALRSKINSLTFHEEGNSSVVLQPITTIYKRTGDSAENQQDNPALVKKLLEYGTSNPSSTNLFIRDRDGDYHPVTLETIEAGKWYRFSTTIDDVTYTSEVGNRTDHGDMAMYQGFRHYDKDPITGELMLDTQEDNWLSNTLYVKTDTPQPVTALQAMQEALEDFLLSAHEKANANSGSVHIGLTVYNKDKANNRTYLVYSINPNASNYINVNKPVGSKSIDEMIRKIYSLEVVNTAASQVDYGMQVAYADMNANKKPNSKRYALLFTNGMPVEYLHVGNIDITDWLLVGNTNFNTSVANGAITSANQFKNNLGAKVYSVGLFDNADEEKLYGKYWYYSSSFLGRKDCNGKQGSYWGNSDIAGGIAFLTGFSMDPKDAYATNRMLAYISSDFNEPNGIGITRGRYAPSVGGNLFLRALVAIAGRGDGYRIDTSTYNYDDKGYYFGIAPKTLEQDTSDESPSDPVAIDVNKRLAAVFNTIDVITSIPKSSLDETAVLLDSVTKYFDIVNDSVEAYDAPRGEMKGRQLNPDVDYNAKEVRVSGFNYMEHWYNETTGISITDSEPEKDARHVVVTFDITRKEGLIGGNKIPTNLNSSAIYDGTETADPNNHDGVLVEEFNIPRVDVSLKMETTRVQDQTAYFATDQNLANLLNPVWLDGSRNEFVKLEYTITSGDDTLVYTVEAGESTGTWKKNGTPLTTSDLDDFKPLMKETTDYNITCEIIPDPTGTVQPKTMSEETATVFVYVPKVTVEDDTANSDGTYPVYSDPEMTWVLDAKGSGNPYTNAQRTAAETRRAELTIPKVTYDVKFVENSSQVSNVTYDYVTETEGGQDTISYKATYNPATNTNIPRTTDFKVVDVTVTPTPIDYDVEGISVSYFTRTQSEEDIPDLVYYYEEEVLTHERVWYDGETGEELENAPNVSNLDAGEPEDIIISKVMDRSPVNASDPSDKRVVHYNSTREEDSNGVFTINPFAHDVTITNETKKNPNEPDYADKQHEFDMTVTLTDGDGTSVPNGTEIKYVDLDDQSATEQTLTFNGGTATGLKLKDGTRIKLLNVPDGYHVSLTSVVNDHYYVDYISTVGQGTPVEDTRPTTEISTPISITDEATIEVVHTIMSVPTTGMGANNFKFNPFIIAAIIVAVLGGAWIAYIVRRKNQAAE